VALLSDPGRSRVVLVGAGSYLTFPPLPTVAGNITALAKILSDPARWGIPDEYCDLVRDPEDAAAVHAVLRAAARAVEVDGLLLVYFAGHGVIEPRTGELHLAVARSDPDAVYATALPYEWVRRSVLDSRASRRVVILDCCYAGRAIGGMAPGGRSVPAEVEIDQSCVLVAAPANRTALAPPDETYTAFTGVLLDLLSHGVPGRPDPLDLTTVYEEIVRVQRARGRPLPELLARNGGERIPLVRNTAARGSAANPYVGRVFRAGPAFDDPELAGATLAILAHSPATGAIGVRLDQPTARSPADVIGERRAAALDAPAVFDGGPVHDVVLLLVALPSGAPRPAGFVPVAGNLGTIPLAADLTAVPGEAAYLFVGYVGWRPGQLEAELARGDLVPLDVALPARMADLGHLR
jgi:putative transcriptional regulator